VGTLGETIVVTGGGYGGVKELVNAWNAAHPVLADHLAKS